MNDKLNKNSGMTLTELLIYMVVSSIGVVLATQVWLDVFKSGVQTKGLLNISSDQGDIVLYLEKDLMKMGNAWTKMADSSMQIDSNVMINPDGVGVLVDNSSFEEFDNGDVDSLVIKGVIEDDSGFYAGYDSISWYVDSDSKLFRKRFTFDSTGTLDTNIVDIVAEGVSKFNLSFGVHGEDTAGGAFLLLDKKDIGYEINMDDSIAIDADDSVLYSELDDSLNLVQAKIKAGFTYSVTINITTGNNLEDFWNVLDDTLQLRMVKSSDTSKILKGSDAFNIYPSSGTSEFNWKFSVSSGFEVGDYKPLIRFIKAGTNKVGSVTISQIKYSLENKGEYREVQHFVSGATDSTAIYNKKNVKSVNVEIELTTGKSGGVTTRTLRRVIPVPQHGEY